MQCFCQSALLPSEARRVPQVVGHNKGRGYACGGESGRRPVVWPGPQTSGRFPNDILTADDALHNAGFEAVESLRAPSDFLSVAV